MIKPEINYLSYADADASTCTIQKSCKEKYGLQYYLSAWNLENSKNKIDYRIYSEIYSDFYKRTDTTTTCSDNWFYDKYDIGTTGASYYGNWNDSGGLWTAPVVAPGDRIREMIRARIAPATRRSRTSLSIAMDVREERARQTLRRIIGEQAFRKFVRNGFITVVPKSGLTYRIYPGHGMTKVYDRGIMVDRLCVILKGSFPPTDSLLMRYLLILNDEGEFSKHAVKHTVWRGKARKLVLPATQPVALTEEWAKLKVA